jgi:hypothetical protein
MLGRRKRDLACTEYVVFHGRENVHLHHGNMFVGGRVIVVGSSEFGADLVLCQAS